MTLSLTSSVFSHEGMIPATYTCDDQDISPPLAWASVPDGTKTFVLICDDPDAPMGTWDHWILFNIPSSVSELIEDIKDLPAGTERGRNSWGRDDYGGPCPPDRIHRYYFNLYALDIRLDLPKGASKQEVLQAIEGHVLEQAILMGRYDLLERQQ